MNDSTMAIKISAGAMVFSMAKYAKPNSPVRTAPITIAPDAIREVPGQRDVEELNAARDDQADEQEVAILLEHLGAVGEDEGQVDVGRRLFDHPRKRRENDRARLTLDHLENRDPFDTVLGHDPPKRRRFHDAEPDVEPDGDHHEAEQERDAPAPNQELVAGNPAEHEHRYVCQQQPGRTAELRP